MGEVRWTHTGPEGRRFGVLEVGGGYLLSVYRGMNGRTYVEDPRTGEYRRLGTVLVIPTTRS